MYKASIEIARINRSMKLKFGLMISSEEDIKFPANKLINKFTYYGNQYFRFNPKPFIILDISSAFTKTEGWSSNSSVSLNRYGLFRFIQGLRKFIQAFKDEKNLFYYRGTTLYVNYDLIEKVSMRISMPSGKLILLKPCVVLDNEGNHDIFYEGCIFCINSMDNYCYLTFNEMEYLLYELSKVDMTVLSCQIVALIQSCSHVKSEEGIQRIILEEKGSSIDDKHESPSSVTIIKENNLPDL